MKKLKIFFIILLLVLVNGCSKEIQIVEINNTLKEIHIINNTIECIQTECICTCEKQKECEEVKCDYNKSKKDQLQIGRLISEINYLKNISYTRLINSSYENLEENLTNCNNEKQILLSKLSKINDTIRQ